MSKKVYYLKKDEKIIKMTSEEIKEFLNTIKDKKFLCPECRICDCEKIRYTDIKRTEGVSLGILDRTVKQNKDIDGKMYKYIDDIIYVYECSKFEEFKETKIQREKQIANKILSIDKSINKIKDDLEKRYSEILNKQLILLEKERKENLELITESSILNNLILEENEINKNYLKRKNKEKMKKLKLENNDIK